MKNLFIFVVLVLMTFSQSCKTSKNASTTAQNDLTQLEKKWKLTELNGKPVVTSNAAKTPFVKLDLSKKSVTGNGGCNSFHGELEANPNGRISFTKITSTLMACPDMTLESSLHKVLETADNYSINNGILSLNKARMAPLARFEEMAENPLEGEWELDYISGQRIAFEGLYPDKKPTIQFGESTDEAKGHSSCNGYGVKFELTGNKIKFGDPRATMMACEGGGEQAFFKTLKTVSQFSVSGNTLNFIMGDIAVMRFQKKN